MGRDIQITWNFLHRLKNIILSQINTFRCMWCRNIFLTHLSSPAIPIVKDIDTIFKLNLFIFTLNQKEFFTIFYLIETKISRDWCFHLTEELH